MTAIKHTRVSNGASISCYIGTAEGPHILIVAGQHGQEIGPIAALVGWHPEDVTHGIVTVIRCANPWGADIRYRFDEAGNDMNTGWGFDAASSQVICGELLAGILALSGGRPPDVVYDLHSSAMAVQGRQVIVPASARGRGRGRALDVLLALAEFTRRDEPWTVTTTDWPGGLADEAARTWGAEALTIEFPSDAPAAGGKRRKMTHGELQVGVREFCDWATQPCRRWGQPAYAQERS